MFYVKKQEGRRLNFYVLICNPKSASDSLSKPSSVITTVSSIWTDPQPISVKGISTLITILASKT